MVNVTIQTHPTVRCVPTPFDAPRYPFLLRRRKDQPTDEANTFDDLKEMLAIYG